MAPAIRGMFITRPMRDAMLMHRLATSIIMVLRRFVVWPVTVPPVRPMQPTALPVSPKYWRATTAWINVVTAMWKSTECANPAISSVSPARTSRITARAAMTQLSPNCSSPTTDACRPAPTSPTLTVIPTPAMTASTPVRNAHRPVYAPAALLANSWRMGQTVLRSVRMGIWVLVGSVPAVHPPVTTAAGLSLTAPNAWTPTS